MPGLRVLIKGLNKVVEFPTDTPMEAIESSIKGGWNDIESISGLPMDTASRMDRAKYLGFDPDNPIYSGTMGDPAKEIIPYGEYKLSTGEFMDGDNRFGGIFGSLHKEVAESHGEVREFLTKNHASHDQFVHSVFYDDASAELADKHFRDILSDHKGINDASDDEIYELLDYVMDQKAIEHVDPDMGLERFDELMGASLDGAEDYAERGEIGWDFQGIKGELARLMGFDSVGMLDEHGESALVLSGRDINAAFDPTKKASKNLLASVAGGAVGAGALTQSDESAASQSANRLLQEGRQSSAFPIPSPILNRFGQWLQRGPQSLVAEGTGRFLETLSLGRENELTDESIREVAKGVALDFSPI